MAENEQQNREEEREPIRREPVERARREPAEPARREPVEPARREPVEPARREPAEPVNPRSFFGPGQGQAMVTSDERRAAEQAEPGAPLITQSGEIAVDKSGNVLRSQGAPVMRHEFDKLFWNHMPPEIRQLCFNEMNFAGSATAAPTQGMVATIDEDGYAGWGMPFDFCVHGMIFNRGLDVTPDLSLYADESDVWLKVPYDAGNSGEVTIMTSGYSGQMPDDEEWVRIRAGGIQIANGDIHIPQL